MTRPLQPHETLSYKESVGPHPCFVSRSNEVVSRYLLGRATVPVARLHSCFVRCHDNFTRSQVRDLCSTWSPLRSDHNTCCFGLTGGAAIKSPKGLAIACFIWKLPCQFIACVVVRYGTRSMLASILWRRPYIERAYPPQLVRGHGYATPVLAACWATARVEGAGTAASAPARKAYFQMYRVATNFCEPHISKHKTSR